MLPVFNFGARWTDFVPASDQLLRKELRYNRLILSDDMKMKAITDHFGALGREDRLHVRQRDRALQVQWRRPRQLRRGRVAVAEIPSYPAAIDVLRAAGARVRNLPIGPGG